MCLVFIFYFLFRWAGICAELIGNTALLAVALLGVTYRDSISPGVMGMTLTFALQVKLLDICYMHTASL